MKVKLPKRTAYIYQNEHLLYYILEMERTQKLETLPENLMVYHVLNTFADEVDNGGLTQYLTNTSRLTYPYLRRCGDLLAHPVFSPYIMRVCDALDAVLSADGEIDPARAEELDQTFYDLDQKQDLRQVVDAYYRTHFSVDKMDIPKLKEPESPSCRYFTIPGEWVCRDTEAAMESLLRVLADLRDHTWVVELWNFYDTYRIIAYSYRKAVDLETVMAHWDDPAFSFSGQESQACAHRLRLISYFDGIAVLSGTDGKSIYAVQIKPSGFAKNEIKMKHHFLMAGKAYDDEISELHIGDLSHKKSPGTYEAIKGYLEAHYREYPNIETFFESGEYPG